MTTFRNDPLPPAGIAETRVSAVSLIGLCTALGLVVVLGAGGCQSGDAPPPRSATASLVPISTQADTSTARVEADWNDVDAAVIVSAPRARMAMMGWDPPERDFAGARRIVYRFQTETESIVTLELTRESDEPAPQLRPSVPTMITLRATAEPFRDPEREGALVRAIVSRLSDLKGVEYRPQRD